jgi:hypothetical protein
MITGADETSIGREELSAYLPLIGLAGQGRMFDADTVKIVAKNVIPKSEEMNVRRCAYRSVLDRSILK